ncbi:Reverse transcriptase (RNA-dependent DNA polymerase) [Arthrobacter sp. cf158]|nr:Reverse transcriptase (RNA-dependent DNA polymerase) [Arthrobacter sp. cf158]
MPQAKVTQLNLALQKNEFDGFVRLDIENFYPSISHAAIMRTLRQKIRKKEILAQIECAIKTPTLADHAPRSDVQSDRGVPQGLPISNLLAEIAMEEIDRRFGTDTRMFYLRYVDDIVILCNSTDSVSICEEVTKACSDIALTVHDPRLIGSKSQIGLMSESIDYLGYVFSSGKVAVRSDSVSKLKASIARVFTRYKYEVRKHEGDDVAELRARTECLWKLKLVITGCLFEGKRRGWLHYFSQIDDLPTLKGLDATVRNFAHRFGLADDFLPKTFTQAFWRINHGDPGDGQYIPNFDLYTPAQMRKVLIEVFQMVGADHFSDDTARRNFHREVKRLADKLEHDISGVS